MSTEDQLGRLGESIVARLFHLETLGVYRFSCCFLGAKAQLDFLINLLDENGIEYGPFFFVQVKTTAGIAASSSGVPVRLRGAQMRAAKARKVPVYLAAVSSVDGDLEEVYAIAIDAALQSGVSVVPRLFSLRQEETRLMIFNEVHEYFQSGMKVFKSQLTWVGDQ
jgi:hypothetical protein